MTTSSDATRTRAGASMGEDLRFGRIPITRVSPVVEGGRFPSKAVPGSDIVVGATVFREGHDQLGVSAVLLDPQGAEVQRVRLAPLGMGTDHYEGRLRPPAVGLHSFLIEGWSDLYETWHHNATVKIEVGVDVELMLEEGAVLFTSQASFRPASEKDLFLSTAERLRNRELPIDERLAAGHSPDIVAAVEREPLRDLVTPSRAYPILVEREAAGRGAWYEFFPRSEGASYDPGTAQWTSGNFVTAATRLPAVAQMGFDVVYLPPIHPIGTSHRKGPNNTLNAGPGDPGSPWAIGAPEGGHDAIHPDLGTFEDFDAFVRRAQELNLEVALDLALQASPDHPWVTEHPEWFTTRVDGSIAYAENPPKKYQDIYPINFDNDPDGIYNEVLRIVLLWVSHGVRIFRVDNPHTKPVQFWEWLIARVNRQHPDVVFLAEAFTRPAMMHALGRAGFQQSYTYFTWRNTKEELEQYFTEVSRDTAAFFRPNFFVNTPDILTEYLQYGGPAAFKVKAVLASMASPLWGVYSGYELYEHVARPGAEEYIDNEKFEYRPRDYEAAEAQGRSLAPFLTRLNEIRRSHPALGDLENLTVHSSTDEATLVFSKHKENLGEDGQEKDTLIVVVNVDPHSARESTVSLNLGALGLAGGDWNEDGTFWVDDLVTGQSWQWGAHNYVRLDAHVEPAHILSVRRTR
ncbi:starch synthase (maltosyl-transferring) [Arthrobacter tumbae]|nr:starch synthase (maltosyl-transferring) [Arthrobacter tumbae]